MFIEWKRWDVVKVLYVFFIYIYTLSVRMIYILFHVLSTASVYLESLSRPRISRVENKCMSSFSRKYGKAKRIWMDEFKQKGKSEDDYIGKAGLFC